MREESVSVIRSVRLNHSRSAMIVSLQMTAGKDSGRERIVADAVRTVFLQNRLKTFRAVHAHPDTWYLTSRHRLHPLSSVRKPFPLPVPEFFTSSAGRHEDPEILYPVS